MSEKKSTKKVREDVGLFFVFVAFPNGVAYCAW